MKRKIFPRNLMIDSKEDEEEEEVLFHRKIVNI